MTSLITPPSESFPSRLEGSHGPTQHPRFFNSIGHYIQVENHLYRIEPRRLIAYAGAFRDLFLLPSTGEGESPQRPIVLEGVKSAEFDVFLTSLNGLWATPLSLADLTAALRLSHLWRSPHARRFAIDKIWLAKDSATSGITHAMLVSLARTYKITHWIPWVFCQLASGPRPSRFNPGPAPRFIPEPKPTPGGANTRTRTNTQAAKLEARMSAYAGLPLEMVVSHFHAREARDSEQAIEETGRYLEEYLLGLGDSDVHEDWLMD